MSGMLRIILVFFVLGSGPYAAANDTARLSGERAEEKAPSKEEELAARAESQIKDAVRLFFQAVNLRQPLTVEVRVATPVSGANDQQTPGVAIDVGLELEHEPPPTIIREARLAIERTLVADGWRLSASDSAELGEARATHGQDDLSIPLAQVMVHVKTSGEAAISTATWVRQALTLVALSALSLLGFMFCFFALNRLLRGLPVLGRPAVGERRAKAQAFVPGLQTAGGPPAPMVTSAPQGELRTVPRIFEQDLPPVPAGGPARPLGPLSEDALAKADRSSLKKAFEQMPFEQALKLLASYPRGKRDDIIEKLELHASVRRRIERELAGDSAHDES